MNKLRKLETDLLENICEKLIDANYLNKDAYNTLGRRLSQEEAIEIRTKSLNTFKELSHKRLAEMYISEGLEAKFDELKRLSEVSPQNIKGWRPVEDPPKDSYGARRPLLASHIQKLKQYKAELESELYDDENCMNNGKDKMEI